MATPRTFSSIAITTYFEVDLETMRDALSVIDEEWERYNRRAEGKIVEIAARRA